MPLPNLVLSGFCHRRAVRTSNFNLEQSDTPSTAVNLLLALASKVAVTTPAYESVLQRRQVLVGRHESDATSIVSGALSDYDNTTLTLGSVDHTH